MTEIKYRVWNGKEFDYYYIGTDSYDVGYLGKYGGQLFTGLKDKNGKEIYEGDVLKTDWDDSTEVVEYGEIGGHSWWGMGFGLPEMGRSSKELEIIGNVWENSELVKQ